jgi:translin
VELTSYLKGLGEAVGELRRYILDSLRRGDTSRCEELMEVMDEIYTLLITMDFPEGVTGGLRHTTDMVRGALERTRGDLTLALRQRELERLLAQRQEQSEEGPR